MAIFLWFTEGDGGYGGVALLLIIPISITLLLRSSVSELLTHGFIRLLNPELHDNQQLDLNKTQRYLNAIAHLIHNNRNADAIRLCEELKKTGELDVVTLETTLEFLGVKQTRSTALKPLNEAARLRSEKKFGEAEQLLTLLLAKNPADTAAAMMLMRLYAEDLQQPAKAAEVLEKLEQRPLVAAAHIEFARRSLDEWSCAKPEKIETFPTPESVDELLAQKFFGSAVEMLEQQIQEWPRDFDLRLKLAEIHALYCNDLARAKKLCGSWRQATVSMQPKSKLLKPN